MKIPIISVTGTKGKTTTVALIADVLLKLGRDVLKVDTTGHFVNGQRKSTVDNSRTVWGVVPTIGPGRYLYEFHGGNLSSEFGLAVLECALGSSSPFGLGYRRHKVGVFLNVYEDHMGTSSRLPSKEAIAEAKQFIFSRLNRDGGWAVFNADDELVVSKLYKVPKTCTLLPVGIDFTYYDIDAHLDAGGACVSLDGKNIVLNRAGKKIILADIDAIPWSFHGRYVPSIQNLMAAAAAVIAENDGDVPKGLRTALESTRLDPYGGKLTLLRNGNNVTILADSAHEKVSLSLIGELAHTLTSNEGRVIGVVRIAHDRTDEMMRETAHDIAQHYDEFVIFDKIDGYWRQPSEKNRRFPEVVGRTSEIFSNALAEKTDKVTRVVREDEAIAYASTIARPGDVVVAIVNDNLERSIGFIKEKFYADFI